MTVETTIDLTSLQSALADLDLRTGELATSIDRTPRAALAPGATPEGAAYNLRTAQAHLAEARDLVRLAGTALRAR